MSSVTVSHPLRVVNEALSRVLTVEWDDGVVTSFTHGALRAHCRCADCRAAQFRGEAKKTGPADSQPSITAISPMGHYAVNIAFSDGHDRGIYPWEYLRELHQPESLKSDSNQKGISHE